MIMYICGSLILLLTANYFLKITVIVVNLLIAIVCCFAWVQKPDQSLSEYFEKNPTFHLFYVIYFLYSLLTMHLFYFFVNAGQVNYLQKLFEINKLQTEYKAMLGLVNQGIISKSNTGIKYFNLNGREIVEQCLQQL